MPTKVMEAATATTTVSYHYNIMVEDLAELQSSLQLCNSLYTCTAA